MDRRAADLVQRFEQVHRDLVTAVERVSDAEWRSVTSDEGWTVGVTAHHVGAALQVQADLAKAMAAGQAPEVTLEAVNQMNAEHARQYAGCTKPETLDLLRSAGEQMAAAIRGLDGADLDRAASLPFMGDAPVTTQRFIEVGVIDHISLHLASIRQAAPA